MIGGHDARLGDRRAGHAIAAQRILENGFLLQNPRLGDGQILLGAGQLGLGAHDLDRRQRPDLHLLLVVAEQLVIQIHRLLFHPGVFIEAHQVPVQVDDRSHDIDHLLLEREVGNLAAVLGDLNVARVHGQTEPLHQMLRNIQAQAGAGGGIEVGPQGTGGQRRVAEAERDIGAGEESLRVAEIRQVVVGDQGVGSADEGAGLRIGGVAGAEETGQHRVQIRNGGSRLADQRAGAGAAGGAGLRRGAGSEAGGLSGLAGCAGRTLGHGRGGAAQQPARLGAEDAGVGDLGAIALQLDIEIVLERQGDGVLQGQVQSAGPQQRFQPARIGEVHRGHRMAAVGIGDPREKPLTLAARGSGVLRAGGRNHEKQYTNQTNRGLKETHVGFPQAKSYQPSAISGQLSAL